MVVDVSECAAGGHEVTALPVPSGDGTAAQGVGICLTCRQLWRDATVLELGTDEAVERAGVEVFVELAGRYVALLGEQDRLCRALLESHPLAARRAVEADESPASLAARLLTAHPERPERSWP